MSINLQQKSLIATLKGNAEKIIENIRYNLKILEQCSLNIAKVSFYLSIFIFYIVCFISID